MAFEHSIQPSEREQYAKDAAARAERARHYAALADKEGNEKEAALWLAMAGREDKRAKEWSES